MRRRAPAMYKVLNAVHERLFVWTRGWVGGSLLGMGVVRLAIVGRKSGVERITMLTAPIIEDDEVVLVASYRGGPKHPAWYLNLEAAPTLEVMRRGYSGTMVAETLHGAEREQLWNRVVSLHKNYATYQTRTDRELPLIVLRPQGRERSIIVHGTAGSATA